MTAEPEFRTILEPRFDQQLTGWRLPAVSVDEARVTLSRLKDACPPVTREQAVDAVKYLFGATKRRQQSIHADAYTIRTLIDVALQYPAAVVDHVVATWHRREGDEAIFTPAQAEFYRALEEAARPLALLRRALAEIVSRGTSAPGECA